MCSNYLGWFYEGCTPDCIAVANFFWIGQPALLIGAHQSGFGLRPLDFEETVFVLGVFSGPTVEVADATKRILLFMMDWS